MTPSLHRQSLKAKHKADSMEHTSEAPSTHEKPNKKKLLFV